MFYMWLRATLPRLRYDQLMKFTWKGLVPIALVNIMLVATILTLAYKPQVIETPSARRQMPGDGRVPVKRVKATVTSAAATRAPANHASTLPMP
jgi:hypothetical protein